MAFPTCTVTPGSGLTINTLPNAGQVSMANSLSVAIASDQSSIGVLVPTTSVAAVRSTALESSHIFKSGAGILLDTYCLPTSVSGLYMLFDATSAPADGAVQPMAVIPVGLGQASGFEFHEFFPLQFGTGLVGVFSSATSPFTKTASATAYMSARVI